MKIPVQLIWIAFAVMFCMAAANAQDSLGPQPKRPRTPDDYRARTLKDLTALPSDSKTLGNKEETMLVHSDVLPSRVRVTYVGSTRRLPHIKKEVVRQWARLYAGAMESYTEPYQTEMLFSEDGARYWLAVRKQFVSGLKRGQVVDVYVIRLGKAKISNGWEPVFLVESVRELQ